MVGSSYPPLLWLRRGWMVGGDTREVGWCRGFILGFMLGEDADRVTEEYVTNIMNARARGVSA